MIALVKPTAKWPLGKPLGALTYKGAQERIKPFRDKLIYIDFTEIREQNGVQWLKIDIRTGKTLPQKGWPDTLDFEWLALEWLELVSYTDFFEAL